MPDAPLSLDISGIERQMLHIRSVTAARIVCTSTGIIDEIHIVGTPTRNPKQVVRDIETILLVQYQTRIDHRKVSLVQIEDRRTTSSLPRILLLGMTVTGADQTASVTVTLGLHDAQVVGVSRAAVGQPMTSAHHVGYATAHALDQLINPRGHVRLEQLQQIPLEPLRICLAHISLLVDDGLENLVGVSIVTEDTNTSSARAVLDAINRRLPQFLQA